MTGRPLRTLTDAERQTAEAMLADGASGVAIARQLGMSPHTWRRIVAAGDVKAAPAAAEPQQDRPARINGKFAPGSSGNPAGRRPGSRNATTLAAEALLQGEAEKLARKAIEKALEGDATALRLVMERVLPVRRGRPAPFHLPADKTGAAGIVTAISAVARAVAVGELSPEEGQAVAQVLEAKRRSIELIEIEARVAALEAGR